MISTLLGRRETSADSLSGHGAFLQLSKLLSHTDATLQDCDLCLPGTLDYLECLTKRSDKDGAANMMAGLKVLRKLFDLCWQVVIEEYQTDEVSVVGALRMATKIQRSLFQLIASPHRDEVSKVAAAVNRRLLQSDSLTLYATVIANGRVCLGSACQILYHAVFSAMHHLEDGLGELLLCNLSILLECTTGTANSSVRPMNEAVGLILIYFLEDCHPRVWQTSSMAGLVFNEIITSLKQSDRPEAVQAADTAIRLLKARECAQAAKTAPSRLDPAFRSERDIPLTMHQISLHSRAFDQSYVGTPSPWPLYEAFAPQSGETDRATPQSSETRTHINMRIAANIPWPFPKDGTLSDYDLNILKPTVKEKQLVESSSSQPDLKVMINFDLAVSKKETAMTDIDDNNLTCLPPQIQLSAVSETSSDGPPTSLKSDETFMPQPPPRPSLAPQKGAWRPSPGGVVQNLGGLRGGLLQSASLSLLKRNSRKMAAPSYSAIVAYESNTLPITRARPNSPNFVNGSAESETQHSSGIDACEPEAATLQPESLISEPVSSRAPPPAPSRSRSASPNGHSTDRCKSSHPHRSSRSSSKSGCENPVDSRPSGDGSRSAASSASVKRCSDCSSCSATLSESKVVHHHLSVIPNNSLKDASSLHDGPTPSTGPPTVVTRSHATEVLEDMRPAASPRSDDVVASARRSAHCEDLPLHGASYIEGMSRIEAESGTLMSGQGEMVSEVKSEGIVDMTASALRSEVTERESDYEEPSELALRVSSKSAKRTESSEAYSPTHSSRSRISDSHRDSSLDDVSDGTSHTSISPDEASPRSKRSSACVVLESLSSSNSDEHASVQLNTGTAGAHFEDSIMKQSRLDDTEEDRRDAKTEEVTSTYKDAAETTPIALQTEPFSAAEDAGSRGVERDSSEDLMSNIHDIRADDRSFAERHESKLRLKRDYDPGRAEDEKYRRRDDTEKLATRRDKIRDSQSEGDETGELPPGRDEPFELPPGRDETPEPHSERDETTHLPARRDETAELESDQDETPESSPRRDKTRDLESERDESSELPARRDKTGDLESERDESSESSQRRDEIAELESGRDETPELPPRRDMTRDFESERDETPEVPLRGDETAELESGRDEKAEPESEGDETEELSSSRDTTRELQSRREETGEGRQKAKETGSWMSKKDSSEDEHEKLTVTASQMDDDKGKDSEAVGGLSVTILSETGDFRSELDSISEGAGDVTRRMMEMQMKSVRGKSEGKYSFGSKDEDRLDAETSIMQTSMEADGQVDSQGDSKSVVTDAKATGQGYRRTEFDETHSLSTASRESARRKLCEDSKLGDGGFTKSDSLDDDSPLCYLQPSRIHSQATGIASESLVSLDEKSAPTPKTPITLEDHRKPAITPARPPTSPKYFGFRPTATARCRDKRAPDDPRGRPPSHNSRSPTLRAAATQRSPGRLDSGYVRRQISLLSEGAVSRRNISRERSIGESDLGSGRAASFDCTPIACVEKAGLALLLNHLVACLSDCLNLGAARTSTATTERKVDPSAAPASFEAFRNALVEVAPQDTMHSQLQAAKLKGAWTVHHYCLIFVRRYAQFHAEALERFESLGALLLLIAKSCEALRSVVAKAALQTIQEIYTPQTQTLKRLMDLNIAQILPACLKRGAEQSNLFLADAGATAGRQVVLYANEVHCISCLRSVVASTKMSNARLLILQYTRTLMDRCGPKFLQLSEVDRLITYALVCLNGTPTEVRKEAKELCLTILEWLATSPASTRNKLENKLKREDWLKLRKLATLSVQPYD